MEDLEPEEPVSEQEQSRFYLGCAGALVAAIVIGVSYLLSLPLWSYVVGVVIFIVTSNFPEWFIPLTPDERGKKHTQIAEVGAATKRIGFVRYMLVWLGLTAIAEVCILLEYGMPTGKMLERAEAVGFFAALGSVLGGAISYRGSIWFAQRTARKETGG